MITRTQAIKNFLSAKSIPDLAGYYNHDMECQVNVAQDNGTRVDGEFRGRQWHGWTDGIQTWKSFRIPYKANSEPEYSDVNMTYDLAQHVEGIGMTGWDWKQRVSRWVAFDFDSIVGHSPNAKNSLSDLDLSEVRRIASEIDWVTVRYSASGKGLHLYVFLDPVVLTANHNEHAALARSILGKMSAITGFDFSAKVDACGGNMWVWHRKMIGTSGLELIKTGIPLSDVPVNWKEHVKVVTGVRKRNLPKFIEDEQKDDFDKMFEELTGQRNRITLDSDHKKLIKFLEDAKYIWWWDADNHMLVTHTCALLEAHAVLSMRGIYKTNSDGSDPNTQNCFCYPLRKGAWVVRRFTQGVQEADSWDQDPQGWTKCYLNREPDLRTAAKVHKGIENEKGGFVFSQAELAIKASESLGINFSVPNWATMRQTTLRPHKDGRLIIEIKREPSDRADEMQNWLIDEKKSLWKQIINKEVSSNYEPDVSNYDDLVRHLTSSEGMDQGWAIFSDKKWKDEPLVHMKIALKSIGLTPPEIDNILGTCIFNCWKVVSVPFQPEYPGDRCWNLNSAQFRFLPSQNIDNLKYPTWTKILQHCGEGLDEAVRQHQWCADNGIINGADYLKCWVASLFQEPEEPLPYLFFHGDQNSGKSIFHEALSLLLTKGYQRADNCLAAKTEFNGELEGAIICVVEETDLNKNKQAYNRIKDWVTSRHLNIRHLYKSPYHVRNTTHWIQCNNSPNACPIFAGDTRITMIHVDLLTDLIPKKILIPLLEKEASDFLAAVTKLELPNCPDRLNLPVLTTSDKEMLQSQNNTSLEQFISECCTPVVGEMVSVNDFFIKFTSWLEPSEVHEWTKIRLGKEIPLQFPKGRRSLDGHWYIGNISFEKVEPTKPKLIVRDSKLIHIGAQ